MRTIEILRIMLRAVIARTLLAGVLLTFVLMAVLGRQAAQVDAHRDFVRFHEAMAPEWNYFPTVNEMMSIVRTKARPDQILVIVGGNSVLYGVGQPRDKVWTKALQQELGDKYAVVNLAFRGALITDGGAVAAEALRKEFPRQILIANAAPTQWPTADGSSVYKPAFWDAYYKGLLIDDPVRNAAIAAQHKAQPSWRAGVQELKARNQLDHWLYFQDFWNDVALTKFNTTWAPWMPGPTQFLQPRDSYPDRDTDRSLVSISDRYPGVENELNIVRGCSQYAYGYWVPGKPFVEKKDPATGKWTLYQGAWDGMIEGIKGAIPAPLKKRTLILMSRNSPYLVRMLTPDEQERDDLAYLHAVELWKAGGYDSIDYGKNFALDDYADRTHLTYHGGEKLSNLVATKVREMSQSLGYTAQ